MRKFISSLLCVSLAIVLLQCDTVFVHADSSFSYTVNDDSKTARITGYSGSDAVINVPSVIDGYTVTYIASRSLNCYYAQQLIIPDTVETIQTNAVYNAGGLRQLTVPASLQAEIQAFSAMNHLTGLTINAGSGTMTDYDYASLTPWYDSRNSLLQITFQSGVGNIGDYSFEGFTSLQTVEMASSIKRIGVNAFAGCSALVSVTLPEELTVLAGGCFSECISLSNVSCQAEIIQIGPGAFEGCRSLDYIGLPAGLTEIDERAFAASGLTTAVIPQSVESIGQQAFDSSVKLWVYRFSGGLNYAQDSQNSYQIIRLIEHENGYDINIGQSVSIAAAANYGFIADSIVYSSSDSSIVAVSDSGTITGISAGTATVCAATSTGMQMTSVKVYRFKNSDDKIVDKEIMLFGSFKIDADELFEANDSRLAKYSYSIADENIATVDKYGNVTGLISGVTMIEVKDLLQRTAYYRLTVDVPVGEIAPDADEVNILYGESYQLSCLVAPADASNKALVYTTSNNKVAVCSADGLIKTVGVGVCEIKITAADGQQASATVKVNVNSAVVSVATKAVPLPQGCYFHLKTTLKTYLKNIHAVYRSSDTSIARVDANGVIYGVSAGQATITISSSDGLASCQCPVEVQANAVAYGVDVSEWNSKMTVKRWTDMKKDGITFAFIRAGYNDSIDRFFNYNYTAAKTAGILCGAYHYITALTAEEAEQYARYMLKWLKGKKFEYPIMLDVEEISQRNLSNADFNAMVDAYCSVLTKAGYCVVVYSYASMLNKANKTIRGKYDMYVAQWNSLTPDVFRYGYTIWQFTSSGRVTGSSGRFDMDISYFDYPTYIKKNHLNGY